MKKTILGLGIIIALGGSVFAQSTNTQTSASGNNRTSAGNNGSVVLESGTQIAGQLQNSLDVQKARVGDQVILKTTQAIKQNGQVVVGKGSRLIGRVTEVQQKAKGNSTSKVGILFERLEQGNTSLPISAAIVSLTQARANVANQSDSDFLGSSSTRSTTSSSSSTSGGLLGGVTNTAGGLLGGATNTVGGVVNNTTQTIGGVTNNTGQTVGGTLRGIQISQLSNASVEGSSLLSLSGENLRLEKGTMFNLKLNQMASNDDN